MKLTSSTVRYPDTVASVRIDYLIALIPVIIWSVFRFSLNALILLVLSSAFALITEFLLKTIIYKSITAPDIYSVYIGCIFSLTLYPDTTYQFAAIGGALSVIIFRMIGSKGQCYVFAPFAARLILASLIPTQLNTPNNLPADVLYRESVPSASTFEFVLGTVDGALGSISALAVMAAALYLVLRKNTNRIGAISYLATIFLLLFFFPLMEGRGMESALNEILSGEILFVFAFVMTDFSWSPRSTVIKSFSGIMCALLTFAFIRSGLHGISSYISVIITGILSFAIDKLYFTLKYLKKEN